MNAKLLTAEEIEVIQDIRKDYNEKDPKSVRKRDEDIELYLRSIGYPDRLTEYLQNKWYIKILRKICNRGKKKNESSQETI